MGQVQAGGDHDPGFERFGAPGLGIAIGIVQALEYGNGLDLWRTFTDDYQLDQLLDLPKPSQSWLESMGWAVHDGPARLRRALKEITP